MKNRKSRFLIGYCVLVVLVITLMIVNILAGSVKVPFASLFGGDVNRIYSSIIWDIRVPRTLAALILGGALAVSGYLLQTFFSNPIAGPFVLGISSGAKLVVALVMIMFLKWQISVGSITLIIAAFVGALISTGFILLVSKGVRNMSMLVICGVMIGYLCSAVTDFVVTFADDSNIVNLHNWSLGSFSGTSMANVRVMSVVVAIAIVVSFFISKPMSAYQIGENYATNMGVNVRRFRVVLILLSSILSACVTAFAGPVSFVGIAVPHVIRQFLKTNKPIVMIPASFLGGAVFCLFSDLVARTLFAPTELSISSVTAIIGAPIVIWMMIGKQKLR